MALGLLIYGSSVVARLAARQVLNAWTTHGEIAAAEAASKQAAIPIQSATDSVCPSIISCYLRIRLSSHETVAASHAHLQAVQ
jgi:hypothetical protein